jgi:hypothetical protein
MGIAEWLSSHVLADWAARAKESVRDAILPGQAVSQHEAWH